jgi:hypothetical protein
VPQTTTWLAGEGRCGNDLRRGQRTAAHGNHEREYLRRDGRAPQRSQVAIVDDAGVQQRNRNPPNDPAKLVPIPGTLPPGTPVAFEAAYGWGWLAELPEALEPEPHLVHPSRCEAIAAARRKNDKVDAATLAQLLRADPLPEAWTAPRQVRDLRVLPGPPGQPGPPLDLPEEPGARRAR